MQHQAIGPSTGSLDKYQLIDLIDRVNYTSNVLNPIPEISEPALGLGSLVLSS